MSNNVFPSLIHGLGWTSVKSPGFNTIVQTAPNGYVLTVAQTYNPLWKFNLVFDFLYDNWPSPNNSKPYAPWTDVATLMGFFMQHQGQWDDFLYTDPTDHSVGPALLTTAWTPYTNVYVGYGILDPANHWQKVTVAGVTGGAAPTWNDSGGTTTDNSATWQDQGHFVSGWPNPQAQLQLVTDGTYWYSPIQRNMGGLFNEDVTDLNGGITVYDNAVLQVGSGTDYTLLGPGLSIPGYSYLGMYLKWVGTPTGPITATFNFYFRVRFGEDTQDFENWTNQLWTIGGTASQRGTGELKLVTSRPGTP